MGEGLEGVICLSEVSENGVCLSDEVLKAIAELRSSSPAKTGSSFELDEPVSAIVEQQLDSSSTESTSYSITLSYEGASSHNYYEQVNGKSSGNGAYFSYDQEFLGDAQAVARECHDADQSNRVSVSVEIDFVKKDLKEAVKVRSVSLWQTMYEGKLFFSG